MTDYDICIVGSGAGAAPVALELSRAGKSVVVLEKGPWFTEKDYFKDDLACCARSVYTPALKDEKHVIEEEYQDGSWRGESTEESGWDFWNGNVVGGSSNFMSGFFYRLKPEDFRLRSEFGPIEGANIADWPISYDELEPYYTKVEHEVGISGKVQPHRFQEPRSTADFPYPPTSEHPVVEHIDSACERLGYTSLKTPRAILPHAAMQRQGCAYSGFCGSYGCATGAKGNARAALLDHAVRSGHCQIIANAHVYKLVSDSRGRVSEARYYDAEHKSHRIRAKIFVVACQAIETSRLLLASTGSRHPNGLGNNHQQLGRNLLFSAGGSGSGDFIYEQLDKETAEQLKVRGPFVNRGLQDWYFIDDKKMGGRLKGGVIDFLLQHPNAVSRAGSVKWDSNDKLRWGTELQQQLHSSFTAAQTINFEVFNDWLPNDNCFVALDNKVKDKWGNPVAKIRIGYHEHDLKVGEYLSQKAVKVLKEMKTENISYGVSGLPPANLVAGGCRFGNDIRTSVLDRNCRVHDVENLYVTDGSFMPTGGSVPYTWTIYANAFRVADIIKQVI